MSLFDDHISAGLATIRAVAASEVTYTTPAGSVPINAVEGQTEYENIDESGNNVVAISTDFMLKVADLVVGGNPVVPAPGHRITKNGRKYVLTPLGAEECFRFSDPGRTEYRVHTKLFPS